MCTHKVEMWCDEVDTGVCEIALVTSDTSVIMLMFMFIFISYQWHKCYKKYHYSVNIALH